MADAIPETSAATQQLVELDPRTLSAHPNNIRTDLGDLSELTASIKAVGVLEPVIIAPVPVEDDKRNDSEDGAAADAPEGAGFRILAGHRRVAAAIAAKALTVPCVIRADLAGDPDAVTTMIVENVHRAQLSPAEEAAAFAQLAAFDLSPAQIGKRIGRSSRNVKDALALHALPEAVKQPVADGTMSLADAAAIEEFADDPKAHARLIKAAASGWGMAYAIAEERRRLQNKAAKAAATALLTDAGVPVVAQPKAFPYGSREARVTDLALADGITAYSADTHVGCPGHAGFVDRDGSAVLICRDPDSHGHVRLTGSSYLSPAEVERRDAAAKAEAERVEALEVAATVRREFVRELLAAAKPADGLLRIALLITFGYGSDAPPEQPEIVCELLGIDTTSGSMAKAYATRLDKTPDGRLWQHTVAQAAALSEANLTRLLTGRRWGYRPALTSTWLDALIGCGYQPSDIEQTVRDEATRDDAFDETDVNDEDDMDDDEDEQGGASEVNSADADSTEPDLSSRSEDPAA